MLFLLISPTRLGQKFESFNSHFLSPSFQASLRPSVGLGPIASTGIFALHIDPAQALPLAYLFACPVDARGQAKVWHIFSLLCTNASHPSSE